MRGCGLSAASCHRAPIPPTSPLGGRMKPSRLLAVLAVAVTTSSVSSAAPITYIVNRVSDDGTVTLTGTITTPSPGAGIWLKLSCGTRIDCVLNGPNDWSLTFSQGDTVLGTLTPANS